MLTPKTKMKTGRKMDFGTPKRKLTSGRNSALSRGTSGEQKAQEEPDRHGEKKGRDHFPGGHPEALQHFRPAKQRLQGGEDGARRGGHPGVEPSQSRHGLPEADERKDGGGNDQALAPPHGPTAWWA
jgi:hypothetical protein